MPRVSVIIPTYNRAHLLGDAIRSVMAQSYQDFELIVADDGSTDETAAVVAAFDERVRHLALPHRGQPAAPRNAALAIARGDYIAFLDSDDLYLPHKLTLQLPVLEADAGVGLVYSNGHFFRRDPQQPAGYVQDGLPTPSGAIFDDLLRGNFLWTPVVLIRRTVLEQVGGYNEDPNLLLSKDYELWLRLAMQTRIVYVPGDAVAIRQHAQNISGDILRLRRRTLYMLHSLDKQFPQVMAKHAEARHEAYARQHSAATVAAARQQAWGLALVHAFDAARRMLQLPGGGLPMLAESRRRRRQRSGINQAAYRQERKQMGNKSHVS